MLLYVLSCCTPAHAEHEQKEIAVSAKTESGRKIPSSRNTLLKLEQKDLTSFQVCEEDRGVRGARS